MSAATVAAVGIAASAATAAYGASKAGKVKGPKARDPYAEGMANLRALQETAPGRYQLEQEYVPKYANLRASALQDYLGGPGGVDETSAISTRSQRLNDTFDTALISPELLKAIQGGNPELADLMHKLTSSANTSLDSPLDPGMGREVDQSVRSAQAARGMGFGPSDVYGEAIAHSGAANDWRQKNRNYATNIAGLNDQVYGRPMHEILSRRSAAFPMALGMSENFGPGQFSDPFGAYASDLNNTNFNAASAQAIAKRNAYAGMTSGGMSALGSLGGAAINYYGSRPPTPTRPPQPTGGPASTSDPYF